MKKTSFRVFMLIVNMIAVVLFGGCSFKDKCETARDEIVALKYRYEAAKEFDELQEQRLERCETVVQYLNSGNVQALYDFYSAENKKDKDLMDRTKAFVYYWNLLEIDAENLRVIPGAELLSRDEGIVTYWYQGYNIDKISDKYNRQIELYYDEVNIDSENENLIGIDCYAIRCDDMWMFLTIVGNDDYVTPNNLKGTVYDRMVAVLDAIDETMLSDEYVNSDKSGKEKIMLNVINSLAANGTDELKCPLIREETIEREILNFDMYYNDVLLSFQFVDGTKFQMVIY